MELSIGTFNLNNLFSRFNFRFRAEVDGLEEGAVDITAVRTLADPEDQRVVTYEGRVVKKKPAAARKKIAERIRSIDVDVLAVQEVEDIDTLRYFARNELGAPGLYPYVVLIEGNDPRLIDLAVLSKYPIGAATSWQHAVHPDEPKDRVFSRDLLEVEILDHARRKRLCTVYNNHLKSHFVPFFEDQGAGAAAADERRRRQAETVARIVKDRTRPNSAYVVLGDMNDPPGSDALAPLVADVRPELLNGLAEPTETRPAPADDPPPPSAAWTHRFKPVRQPARYELFDQVWLSPSLAGRQVGSWVDRRTKLGGDGSDHDPAWVVIDL